MHQVELNAMCQELCTHIKFVIIPLIEFYRFKLPKNDIMFKKAMNRKKKGKGSGRITSTRALVKHLFVA